MDSRHWQHENHQVARDIETSIGLPCFADIDAMTRNWFLERLCNWVALKNGRIENGDEPVGDDERKYQIATDSQPFLDEYPQVQKHNRDLCAIQRDFVKGLKKPIILGPVSSSDLISFQEHFQYLQSRGQILLWDVNFMHSITIVNCFALVS